MFFIYFKFILIIFTVITNLNYFILSPISGYYVLSALFIHLDLNFALLYIALYILLKNLKHILLIFCFWSKP